MASASIAEKNGAWRDESDLYRDPETRLPRHIYPFLLEQDDAGWMLLNLEKGGCQSVGGPFTDIFSGFRALVDAYEKWFQIRPVDQVYFIGTRLRVGDLVKVGYSRDPEARLRQLQTSTGEKLQIFATIPGTRETERKYHNRWRARRRAGEWFTIGDCIIAEIERIRSAA